MTLARCTQCGFSDTGTFCSACGRRLSVDGAYTHAARELASPIFDILQLSKLILNPARLVEGIESREITTAAVVKFFIAIALTTSVIQYLMGFINPELKVTNEWFVNMLSIPLFGDLLLLIYYGLIYAIILVPMNYIFFQKRPFYKFHEAMTLSIVISAISLPVDIMSNLVQEDSNEFFILLFSYIIALAIYESFCLSKIYKCTFGKIVIIQLITSFIIVIIIGIIFIVAVFTFSRGR